MPDSKQQGLVGDRVASVDALRGFAMFLIIGSGEIGGAGVITSLAKAWDSPVAEMILRQMSYTKWQGFHFYLLAMPLFAFVVGVAMPFSFSSRLARGYSRMQLYQHTIKRAVILFVLGLIAGGHLLAFDLSELRIGNNVLESIAVGYLVASVVMLNMRPIWQMITTVVLLLLFWALMMWVPVPGYGAGVLTREGNLSDYIDKLIFGRFYAWNSMFLLSGLPFVSNIMLGILAGHLLRSERSQTAKVIWLLGAGVACLALGLIWANWFPIIRSLWTSSFVLLACGLCYLLLGLFYLVIDIWGFRRWAFFFTVIGMNSIAVYMAAHLFDFRHIGNIFVGGLAKWLGPWDGFVQALAAFGVIWLILWYMYRNKSFIKV